MKAAVVGLGTALPSRVVPNADIVDQLGSTDGWIFKRTGIRQRHWIDESRESLADLTVEACLRALADAGHEPADVDEVVVGTLTPDRLTPGVATDVAERIGAHGAAAFDVSAACAGFLIGLDHVAARIESGRTGLALVVGADALSRITDLSDRQTGMLFGDGAGAVVVEARDDVELGCAPMSIGAEGKHADLLHIPHETGHLVMDGREVYRHSIKRMVESTLEAAARAGVDVSDLDLFVAHQANARIVAAVGERLGLAPERVALNIDRVANTSSASIPLALGQAERDGALRPGARVGLCTFAAGFIWGAGVIGYKEVARDGA